MRAVEIAPECGSIQEVKCRLIREGYFQVNAHLSPWRIRREIMSRLRQGTRSSSDSLAL